MADASEKKRPSPKTAEGQAKVLERVSMKRWMRLTARRHSAGEPPATQVADAPVDAAADAAANAIAQMLGKPNERR